MGGSLEATVGRQFVGVHRAERGRIGAEVEMFWIGPPLDPDRTFDAAFRRRARPTLEPGGQLELSPPPARTATGLVDRLAALLAEVERAASTTGASISLTGTQRRSPEPCLRLRTPRYLAMQDLFDRAGPDGRRMMRQTASLQVCVDLLPGRAGNEQWLVANLAGPALTATFANSWHLDGRPTDRPGNRTAIWCRMDPVRTGYDGRHLDLDDPIGAYAAFARAAERLAIPEAADDDYHLGTLFPPVRPRGEYLELRFLDAQPLGRLGDVITRVDRLLNDATARHDALDLLTPHAGSLATQWRDAADGRSELADDLMAILGRAGPAHPRRGDEPPALPDAGYVREPVLV